MIGGRFIERKQTTTGTTGLPTGVTYRTAATVNTTNATVTTIDTIALSDSTIYNLVGLIVGRCTGGAGGNTGKGCRFEVNASYIRAGAGPVIVGGDVPVTSGDTDIAGWDATFTISSNNILLRVTGAATDSITWYSTVFIQKTP